MTIITPKQLTELKKNDIKTWFKLPEKIRQLKQPFKAILICKDAIKVICEL